MKTNKGPTIIMLLAGLLSLAMTIIMEYDLFSILLILLITLLTFYAIGLGAITIISRLTQKSIEREKLEKIQAEEEAEEEAEAEAE